MEKEFNLSEEREELIKHFKDPDCGMFIETFMFRIKEEDKEFIRLLKEIIPNFVDEMLVESMYDEINKLVGDKPKDAMQTCYD